MSDKCKCPPSRLFRITDRETYHHVMAADDELFMAREIDELSKSHDRLKSVEESQKYRLNPMYQRDKSFLGLYVGNELEEAALIHKRLLDLKKSDFTLGHISESPEDLTVNVEKLEAIQSDLASTLSKRELIELFHEESEFANPVDDLIVGRLTYASNIMIPIFKLVEEGKVQQTPDMKMVEEKFIILSNYCACLAYYLALKLRKIHVQNHPILKLLFCYRLMIMQFVHNEVELNTDDEDSDSSSSYETPEPKLPKYRVDKNVKSRVTRIKSFNTYSTANENNVDEDRSDYSEKLSHEDETRSPENGMRGRDMEKQTSNPSEGEKARAQSPKISKDQRNPRVKHKNKIKTKRNPPMK